MNKTKRAAISAPTTKVRVTKRTHPWSVLAQGKAPVRQRSWLDVIK